jgi:hypothetical protein
MFDDNCPHCKKRIAIQSEEDWSICPYCEERVFIHIDCDSYWLPDDDDNGEGEWMESMWHYLDKTV